MTKLSLGLGASGEAGWGHRGSPTAGSYPTSLPPNYRDLSKAPSLPAPVYSFIRGHQEILLLSKHELIFIKYFTTGLGTS